MCNRYEQYLRKEGVIRQIEISDIKIPLRFDDLPDSNRGLTGTIRPTDPAFVLTSGGRFSIFRWGFPSNRGPVINVRDDYGNYGVERRGLTPITSFYESTDPVDKKQKRKDWWEFTPTTPIEQRPLMFAVSLHKDGFYSLITTEPGPDIAPIKHRQPVVLPIENWSGWLAGDDGLLRSSAAGTWSVLPKVFPPV